MLFDYFLIIYTYFITYYITIPKISDYVNYKSGLSLKGDELLLYKNYYCSFVHAVSCLIFTGVYYPSPETINNYNHQIDDIVILNSLVYFSLDICYCFHLKEWGYFAHHLVPIMTISLSLLTGEYAKIIIVGLFIAETTNPIQNIAWILNKHSYSIAKPIFFINNLFYIFFRGGCYPLIYLYYRNYIPNNIGGNFLSYNGFVLYSMSLKWSIHLVKKNYQISRDYFKVKVS